jgi:outer membrane protein assembly factor BamE (lipoprotein component of BamABCDE complex)
MPGCIYSGRRIDNSKVAHIVEGQSTREGVEQLLGSPQHVVEFEDGSVALTYEHTRTRLTPQGFIPLVGLLLPGGTEIKSHSVYVLIGTTGKMTSVQNHESEIWVSTGGSVTSRTKMKEGNRK